MPNQLAAAVCCRIRFMARQLHAALAALLFLFAACDTTTASTTPRNAAAEVELAQPVDDVTPTDCRSAYFCLRDCMGAGFLIGEPAADLYPECIDRCDPADFDAHNHWTWWTAAVETQCDDDWTDACIWDAARPDLSGDDGDLSGTVLDGCLREGASW